VRYEAAGTLVTLSSAPTAIKAAATCYIELIVKESDNNVKLIVLDRLIALKVGWINFKTDLNINKAVFSQIKQIITHKY